MIKDSPHWFNRLAHKSSLAPALLMTLNYAQEFYQPFIFSYVKTKVYILNGVNNHIIKLIPKNHFPRILTNILIKDMSEKLMP